MNVGEQIGQLIEEIRLRAKLVRWVRKHAQLLSALPDVNFVVFGNRLDFDNLSHADIIKVIRAFGGKWQKSESAGGIDKVDYKGEFDGKMVRFWAGEPPPSCRIVEVEEDVPEQVIPAHKKKVRKLICTDHPEPVTVALAQANIKPQP